MYKKNATWNDLVEHIGKMSEEEKRLPVLIWGEEKPLCSEVVICIDNEDMCYDPENQDDGCFLRSNYGGDSEDEICVALVAGKTYLFTD